MVNIELLALLGFISETAGGILIAWSVFSVHNLVGKEMKLDVHSFKKIKMEKRYSLIGLALIALGFLLQLPVKLSPLL